MAKLPAVVKTANKPRERSRIEVLNEVQSTLSSARNGAKQQHKSDILSTRQKLAALGSHMVLAEQMGVPLGRQGQVDRRQMLLENGKRVPVRNLAADIADRASGMLVEDYHFRPDSPQSRYLEAAQSASSQMRAVPGTWRAVSEVTTKSSGKDVIRYRVTEGSRTLEDSFKHKVVAEQVAAALSQTGGLMSDPRIAKIRALCAEEQRLLSEVSNAKRILEGVDPANEKRHGASATKLSEAKASLARVRRQLGIV